MIDAGGREKPIAGSRGRSHRSKRGYDDASTITERERDFARECARRGEERSAVSLGSLNINLVSPGGR